MIVSGSGTRNLNLIRFAHNWNVGILGFGLRLVEPTARRGKWDVGKLAKFIVNMGGKII